MRIIAGKLKGRKITLSKNLDLRPTTDRAKESIFGKIEAHKEINGADVLDLFGGSGNLGLEAISRGAHHVDYIEKNPDAVKHIQNTAELFKVDDQVTVINMPVETFIQNPSRSYDLIFADPPYDIAFIESLVEEIIKKNWLKRNGWFILEHDKRHKLAEHPHCLFSKAYGRTIVSIFQADPVVKE
ncbi:MAG: 16S rRNA (guanine(966)-N(2))-methyltransferase RsmD [Balneolales bacterium]